MTKNHFQHSLDCWSHQYLNWVFLFISWDTHPWGQSQKQKFPGMGWIWQDNLDFLAVPRII
jgi:hypothetical protein